LYISDNQNNLVSRLATRRRLAIGEDWSQDVHFGEQSELRYSYHVFCDEYYFGDSCAEYCRPRDDTLGHYTCDEEGNKHCLEGWKGNYCSDRKYNRVNVNDYVAVQTQMLSTSLDGLHCIGLLRMDCTVHAIMN
jgi:hypothetical protein